MSKLGSNLYDFSSKDILNNNSSSYQNNYYKEDKNISYNSKTRSDSQSIKNNCNSNSKNKYKVTYSNSILDNNINRNIYQNLENKNVLIINNKTNNSFGNIKEINYYTNKKNGNNNNIKSHNFYNKKINEILNSENNIKNKINENNKTDNIINSENNNKYLINKTHSVIHNINNNNRKSINKSNSKNKKNIKNIPSKKGPRNIYAKYADKKRPSLPISNKIKTKNTMSNNKNKSKKKEENLKENNSKIKISFVKNNKSNNNKYNNILSSNYYTNTYNNENNININKNNLMPVSLKYTIFSNKKERKPSKTKEIKKSQSQSYMKYTPNQDLNSSNYKYNNKNKSKNNNKNEISYKGIIMNKKNMIKNKLIKSSSHSNSTSKKSPVVCINYKNKYLNNSNSKKSNKVINKNYTHFMNNLPDEYNKDQLFIKIRNLWNKLKVTYTYQEMFITLTKQIENEESKKAIFRNELDSLKQILNNLDKLNEDIQKRNDFINRIKNYNNYNNIGEIKELLNSLRMISIDIVFDYISFLKEISYDLLRNKFNLDNIKIFNKNYLNNMKTDTNFLYLHNYFNKIFNFSKKSDPFLIYPSLKQKNTQYAFLPINKETLEKINECEYFLLTEKICQYSMCNNKNNVNNLLFNDQDNIIKNLIDSNKSIINTETSNNLINCYSTIKNNENYSPFGTPINKTENSCNEKASDKTNKYDKFCYINNINNNSNDNKKNENQDIKEVINKMPTPEKNNNINNNSESDKNNSIINNSNDINSSPIQSKIKINDLILNDTSNNEPINNISITPYIPKDNTSLSALYTTYLSSVSDNVKQSFNINEDIFYYANIGIYPKIILFKDKKNINIKGICTISFNQTINSALSLNKKILTVTSISCSKGEKISEILLNLIEFCKNEEIFYESIEVNLYYIKKEDGNFVLDEELEKEIKAEAKFKWIRLENDGEKRKIKYHYIPNNIITNKENSIFNNMNINNLDMNCNKCAIYINNFVLMKYYEELGINDISMEENSKLFFIIKLLNKYFLLNENNNEIEKNVENILTNLKGLKLKKIVRNISDYNNTLLTSIEDFKNDYLSKENYNLDLLNTFLEIIEKLQNQNNNEDDNMKNNICLDFNIICTNFSNIIKIDLDGYEYNIISMNEFIIEVFKISNDENNKDVIYFVKSEIDNISFIFYEENEENQNNNDENYIKLLFNKVLKKILIKDSEEPIKSYKRLGLPSFSYQKKFNKENNENDHLKIIQYDILDCNESFDFCLENIPNYNTKFSFPLKTNIFEDNEIKIIKNNFVVAVLNSDLILDYHLPSMNIYYINKDCWLKTNKK